MNKLILTLDSTQINAFMQCPQMWKYGQQMRLTPAAGFATGEAMQMGTLGHMYLERYYKALSISNEHGTAIEYALQFDPDRHICKNCKKIAELHGSSFKCPEGETEWKPEPYPLGMPERAQVQQRFREYCYTYMAQKDIIPKSTGHVEVGFSHILYETMYRIYILEGRMDLIGSIGTTEMWMDHKFQLRQRNLYKKSVQFRNYGMIAYETMGINTGMVNYIRLTKGVSKDTLSRELITFGPGEHAAWKKRLLQIYDNIAYQITMNAAGDPKDWPGLIVEVGLEETIHGFTKNWAQCSGSFGYPCDFAPLCEESHDSIKDAKVNSLYTIRPEWKPW